MRVLLAEDQYLLRDGLTRLLGSHGITVVEAVTHGDRVLDAIEEHEPDLSLLDIRLPPTYRDEGLTAALAARRRHAERPVMLLSQHVEHLYVQELLDTGEGGLGYLLKDRVFDDQQFVTAMRSVQQGGTVVDPAVVEDLMQRERRRNVLDRLTSREREVLGLMAEGDSNSTIAQRLVVTDKAVAKHINSIMAKLDLSPSTSTSRRVAAVLAYLRS